MRRVVRGCMDMVKECQSSDLEVFQESKLKFRALCETTAEMRSICSEVAGGDNQFQLSDAWSKQDLKTSKIYPDYTNDLNIKCGIICVSVG